MRYALALLALAAVACSDDATGPSSPDATLTVANGAYYGGFTGTVSVKNTTTEAIAIRQIDCGTQVERQSGTSWTSYVPTSTVCNFVEIPAGETMSFLFTLPPGTGTYRVVTMVRKDGVETAAHSNSFAVTAAPVCQGDDDPGPCTP